MSETQWNAKMHGERTPPPGDIEERTVLIVTAYGERFKTPLLEETGTYAFQPGLAMSLAGIHDPQARARCTVAFENMADVEGRTPAGRVATSRHRVLRTLSEHGGVRPPVSSLPSPAASIRTFCKPDFEGLVSLVATIESAYSTRYESLLAFLGSSSDDGAMWDPLLLTAILTARLEDWHDDQVWQLPQAIAYLLSCHVRWRRTAAAWLLPHRKTWLPDYLAGHPEIRAVVRLAGKTHHDLPSWLARPRHSAGKHRSI